VYNYAAPFDVFTLYLKQYNDKIDADNYPAGGIFAFLNFPIANFLIFEVLILRDIFHHCLEKL
jgi:hypothetical protein